MSVNCWVLSSVGVGHTLTKLADGVLESRPAVLISPACVFELINTGISNHYLFVILHIEANSAFSYTTEVGDTSRTADIKPLCEQQCEKRAESGPMAVFSVNMPETIEGILHLLGPAIN